MQIRISGTVDESIVDGVGFRFVVFTQGCPHNCLDCHNPNTHDYNGGILITTEELIEKINTSPLVTGVTISGGEPFVQPESVLNLVKKIHDCGKNIWIYTGYTIEQLMSMENEDVDAVLANIDVLVDGLFVLAQRDLTLNFRGSHNQRLIDVPATLKSNEVVLYELL